MSSDVSGGRGVGELPLSPLTRCEAIIAEKQYKYQTVVFLILDLVGYVICYLFTLYL
jgi:hypothetical protein